MAKKKPKPHEQKSIIKQALEQKKSSNDLSSDGYFNLSYRHLDREQGDSLYQWEEEGRLAHAIDVLANYCNDTLLNQIDGKKFTIYGDFPSKGKTSFYHPTHVPEDAQWSRIHITGIQCIIGHVVKNSFYVVFLDGNHEFWESSLKNT